MLVVGFDVGTLGLYIAVVDGRRLRGLQTLLDGLAILAVLLRELTGEHDASADAYQVALDEDPPVIGHDTIMVEYLVYGDGSTAHQSAQPHEPLKEYRHGIAPT